MSHRIHEVPTGGFNGEIQSAVAHVTATGNVHNMVAADIPTASGESVQEVLDQCIIYPGGSTGGDGGAEGVSVLWANILNKPQTFAPSVHLHAIKDVTGLEDTLADLLNRINGLQAQITAMTGTIEIESVEYTGGSFAQKIYTLQFTGGAAPAVVTTSGWTIETGACE